jgi:hypothetical protein
MSWANWKIQECQMTNFWNYVTKDSILEHLMGVNIGKEYYPKFKKERNDTFGILSKQN